jgi:hypothetical protein
LDCGTPTGRGAAILQYTPYSCTAVILLIPAYLYFSSFFSRRRASGSRHQHAAAEHQQEQCVMLFICLLSLACYHNLGSSDPHHLNGP